MLLLRVENSERKSAVLALQLRTSVQLTSQGLVKSDVVSQIQISNKTSLLASGSELNLKNVVLTERTAGDPVK